jgi:Outer membrane protein beta-barrel domain
MKKLIAALTVVCLAQWGNAQTVSVGIKAGANVSNFTGKDFNGIKKEALFGFHGGGWMSINLGGLAIQPELLVSTQGAKIDFDNNSTTEEYKLTYLSVPVMVKFKSKTGLYGEIGPQVSFKLDENIGTQTINDFAKNLDLSAAVGIGFQGKSGLGIGARYLAGLSKVGDFNGQPISPDFKNSVVQVSIMIGLNPRK